MKTVIKFMLCSIAFIAACQSKNAKVQSSIDGIYVNHAQSEYAVADDTLTFTHTDGQHYIITRIPATGPSVMVNCCRKSTSWKMWKVIMTSKPTG